MKKVADWDESAALYADLAPKISFYRISSNKLVQAANLDNATTVLDLGCGSACLSMHEILQGFNNVRTIIGVDSSPNMLEVASRKIHLSYPNESDRVQFLCSRAEDIDHIVEDKSIDRVICSSALGMFQLEDTLKAVHQVLKQSQGLFIFNLAEWDFVFDGESELQARYVAIDNELRRRGLPEKEIHGAQSKLSRGQLNALLEKFNFSLQWHEEYSISVQAEDWNLFYSFPTIIRKSLPYLPFNTAKSVLSMAMKAFSHDNPSSFKWATFRYLAESPLCE